MKCQWYSKVTLRACANEAEYELRTVGLERHDPVVLTCAECAAIVERDLMEDMLRYRGLLVERGEAVLVSL